MRRIIWLAVILAPASLLAGCCPTTTELIEMRDVVDAEFKAEKCLWIETSAAEVRRDAIEDAHEQLVEVMEYFGGEDPRSACWRAEAITSMYALDRWLGEESGKVGPGEAEHPVPVKSVHARVKDLLKREYRSPNLKSAKGENHNETCDRLRAWSVNTLGRMPDDDLDAFFVSALAADVSPGKSSWQVSAAAFNALVGRVERIRANRDLRNKLLTEFPKFLSASSSSSVPHARRLRMEDSIRFFQAELKNYEAVVDLVPAKDEQAISDDVLMAFLEWNYQKLSIGEHRKEGQEIDFRRNVNKLLTLAWHDTPRVRTRVRIILTEFAPLPQFERLVTVLENKDALLNEDHEFLANLIPVASQAAGKDAAHQARKEKSLDLLFADIGDVGSHSREVIYARLLEHEHRLLAKHLLAVNGQVFNEPPIKILQHIRYLGHLYKVMAEPKDRAWLASAMARFIAKKRPEVRRQVVAQLLDAEPLILATTMVPQVRALSNETTKEAKYLLATYVGCLLRLEQAAKAAKKPPYPKERQALFGRHPYNVLISGLARREMDVKEMVCVFLKPRDPNRLIEMFCLYAEHALRTKRTITREEYVLLGDLAEEKFKQLTKRTLGRATGVIQTGLVAGKEEQTLMCCRYLLELGAGIPAKKLKALPESARTMLKLASFAKKDASKKKPSKKQN